MRAQDVWYRARVAGDADEEELRELLLHTDRVAEIPNSLRHGAEVTLREVEVETSRAAPQAAPVEPPAA